VLACADRSAAHWQVPRAGANERSAAIRLRGLGHDLAKDYPSAITAFREAVDLCRSLSPESPAVAAGLSDMADVSKKIGQLDEAEAYYREVLAIGKAYPEPEIVAGTTGNLAELALDREKWPEAELPAKP
jgi:tetratricopeptide (TPR) repeat protein